MLKPTSTSTVDDSRYQDALATIEHTINKIESCSDEEKKRLQDDLAQDARALIFATAVLSFHDARPRGTSHIDSVERDEWTLDDLCRHLQFSKGTLCLDTDYVRGRMMKTRVTVWPTGVVEIQTTNRHQMASRWVETRKGKKHPRAGACGGWALRDMMFPSVRNWTS